MNAFSNLLLRLSNVDFQSNKREYNGVEYEFKTVRLPNSNQRVKAQIWDTTGNKEYQFIATTHYRFAVGAIVVYDITNFNSFSNCRESRK